MLLELTVAEQRFNAVMEVLRDGLTVVEVAERYGVSRQAAHGWLRTHADYHNGCKSTLATASAVGRRPLPGGWRMGCPPVGSGADK